MYAGNITRGKDLILAIRAWFDSTEPTRDEKRAVYNLLAMLRGPDTGLDAGKDSSYAVRNLVVGSWDFDYSRYTNLGAALGAKAPEHYRTHANFALNAVKFLGLVPEERYTTNQESYTTNQETRVTKFAD